MSSDGATPATKPTSPTTSRTAERHLRALRDAASDPQAEPRGFDPTVLIDVIHAHLDAVAGFVDIYSEFAPGDASPEDRERLIMVECLVNQALDGLASAATAR